MKYSYENFGDDQFEKLIVVMSSYLFGNAVQGFCKGPDGGRDARFVGTAQDFPSVSCPWQGTVIIQAKHTNGYNKSFSEKDFYSPTNVNTVIGKEIPRIKKLREGGLLDYYVLFSNRKLSGNANDIIVDAISEGTGLPRECIYLAGLDQIERWMKKFPGIALEADIDPVDSPLCVSPDELANIIEALASQIQNIDLQSCPPVPRVSYSMKNTLNNMDQAYADYMRKGRSTKERLCDSRLQEF